jgi:hypothetical protein
MDTGLPADTVGLGVTVTVTDPESTQPKAEVPTILYVVVAAGDATGFAQLLQERLAAGLQA